MSDARETLRRGIGDYAPRPDGYERVLQRRDRKRRNQRIMAGALAAGIVLIGALAFVEALRSARAPTGDGRAPKNGGVVFSALFVIDGVPGSVTRADPRDIFLTLPGRDPQRILGSDLDGIDQRCPRFSPDGTKLAYVEGSRDEFSPGSIVAVVEVDDDGVPSGPPVQVVGDANRSLGGCAQWSPDGSKLAIIDQEYGLRIATLDGRSNTVRFGSFRPGTFAGGRTLAWSPDGSTMAVVDAGTVWLVPVDGGEARTFWGPVGRQIPGAIAWAPDGSWLAIGGSVGPAGCCGGHRPFMEIVRAADGSRSALATAGDPNGDTVKGLTWLPLQGRILVTYFGGGNVLVDPIGDAPATVLDLDHRPMSGVELSPDGRWLLYVADDTVSTAVMAEPLDGSSAPVPYSPWSYGLFTNEGNFSWRPTYP